MGNVVSYFSCIPLIKKDKFLFAGILLALIVSISLMQNFSAIFLVVLFWIIFFASIFARQWFVSETESNQEMNCFYRELQHDFISSLCIALFLEFFTVIGLKASFSLNSFSFKRYLLYFSGICAFSSLIKLFVCACNNEYVYSFNKRVFAGIAAASLFDFFLSFLFGFLGFSKSGFIACTLPVFIFAAVIVSSRDWWEKPWLVCGIGIVTVGIGIILAFPVTNLFSWDDQIHFQNANEVSFIVNSETTVSDRMLENLFEQDAGFTSNASLGKWPIRPNNHWKRGDIERFSSELNLSDSSESLQIVKGLSSAVSFQALGYLPSAFGIWLGRFFHLPFSVKFVLGKLFNLLFYAVICVFAIKLVPCKKYFMTLVALLPSNVFMAANYSYDPWINCLTLLGVALLLRLIVGKEETTPSTYILSILIFVLAFAPKAVYFPLLGLFFLIPCTSFGGKSQRLTFKKILVFFGILVVVSFLVPFIASNGGGAGDARGGSDVNSSLQVHFILSNPVSAFYILTKFVFGEFLNPEFVNSIGTNIAYLGDIAVTVSLFHYLPYTLLLLVGVLDSDSSSIALINRRSIVWVSFLLISICYLISAALYISFTGVASNHVAGVQARYLNPLLFVSSVFVFNVPCLVIQKHRGSFDKFALISAFLLLYSVIFILLYSRCFG